MPSRHTLPAPTIGSNLPLMVGAVIYVRVSTKEQTENLSLPTQLRACEEYCRRQGYEILERFHEEGESAKTTDRSQLQNLLKYCRTRKGKVHFVVVYNLTRFAREKYDHFALRAHLKSLGISLRSATEPIDDTSTGKLMEGVLASFAQFDNDVRSDRTRAGMRAALELGRWTFPAPIGYLNAPKWSGKSLVPDPERAPLIARAFEELATGRFTKQEVIARVTEAGLRTRRGLVLSPQSFGQMVRNSIYVGRVESPDYGVSTRGDFEPLIDEATFYRVQAVLDGRVVVAGPRPRNHPDFPLRGFVRCETCGRPLTGSWSKGRNGHYAYYHCQRQCRAVNISKATLEGAFVDELALLQPTPGYMRLVKDRILCVWEQRRAEAKDRTNGTATAGECHPAEAGQAGRGVPLLGGDRRHDLRPATRQAARGADARQDRSSLRGGRRTRCGGHPGLRRTHSAARLRPVGAGFARLQATAASSCSFPRESRTTEIDSIEPPQRRHFSTTWRRPRVLMKEW